MHLINSFTIIAIFMFNMNLSEFFELKKRQIFILTQKSFWENVLLTLTR